MQSAASLRARYFLREDVGLYFDIVLMLMFNDHRHIADGTCLGRQKQADAPHEHRSESAFAIVT